MVTLKNDAPIKIKLNELELKNIDKDKLYKFLRDMEFNRLLSSAISAYGEPDIFKNKEKKNNTDKRKPITRDDYHLISKINELDFWIKEAEEAGDCSRHRN